jgi:hypothetical protein
MKTFGLIALVLTLAACAGQTPVLDSHFGEAVRTARAQQTLNPDASLNVEPVIGQDGQATKEAIDRYYSSYKTPPPSMNVINIGGSMTSNNK